jgi:hypothetical protein
MDLIYNKRVEKLDEQRNLNFGAKVFVVPKICIFAQLLNVKE